MSRVVELPRRPEIPVLNEHQLHELHGFAETLSPEQLWWASGYLAGLQGKRAPTTQAPPVTNALQITVLFGSQTGTGAGLAARVAERARSLGFEADVQDMLCYRRARLREDRILLLIVSTHGDGDPPDGAQTLHALLTGPKAPRLTDARYAVLALGDASYPRFCQAGRDFDEALAAAGASRIAKRVECDLDYEDAVEQWTEQVLGALSSADTNTAPVARAVTHSTWSRRNPFAAPLLERGKLNGRGSSREVWHLELDLDGSELAFAPGDSLSVTPQNPPALVASLLERLDLDANTVVNAPQGQWSLAEALTSRYEITRLTRVFLDRYAGISAAADLRRRLMESDIDTLGAWMAGRDVLDVIEAYPIRDMPAQVFVDLLRTLPARRYSIASSLLAYPGEAHLTVAPIRYASHGRNRFGVASTWLADRLAEDDAVPVFLEGHSAFHLPEAHDRPIIMIGAGTGVAPYRAFLQEREALGATGRNWLFFGDRNFTTDFLYQREWLDWQANGWLTRLDVAFSRDQERKVYVQDRLRERGGEIYAWLEEGAVIYVCGAERMGHGVHRALIELITTAGELTSERAEAYVENLKLTGRYHRDVY